MEDDDAGPEVDDVIEDAAHERHDREAASLLRGVELRALDQATRIHGRLAGRLAAISTSPLFRDPADALGTVRADLEARLHELDRMRVPGMRRPLEWPAAMTELLEAVEGRERKTA